MQLSTKQKKYIYWLVSVVSVFIITLAIYDSLGGFDEVKVTLSRNNVYNIAGKEYKGRITNDSLHATFKQIKDLIITKQVNGELCVINYHGDFKKNVVHQFVGILLNDDITELPASLEVREFKSATTFKAGLGMHPLVMPNTEKVEAKIRAVAQEKGIELAPYSMEILYPDNSILVEMFAK